MKRPNPKALGLLAIGIFALCAVMFVVGNRPSPTEPTLPGRADSTGDRVLVDKMAYRYPLGEARNFIKRIKPVPEDFKK